MPSVFISYRRADSQGEAGRLFDDLSLRFRAESVFMDVATLEPGRDFRTAVQSGVSRCDVLLAMIGPLWLDPKVSGGARRLDDPADVVRGEIASALRRGIPVVPVLVRGATMPGAAELPEELKELSYRNAVELTHARWRSDVQVLMEALGRIFEGKTEAATPSLAEEPPAAAEAGARIEAETVKRVERELAAYIGPIAEVVVKRVAKRSAGVKEFYALAAAEIEAESDRVKFLRACGR